MRSLYDCLNAKFNGKTIKCAAGHELNAPIGAKQLAQGDPLRLEVCQQCPDFVSMGPPLRRRDMGWLKKSRRKK
jgi:hypothetical protein